MLLWPFMIIGLLLMIGAQAVENAPAPPELATSYLGRVTLGLLVVLVSIVLAARLLRGFTRFQLGAQGQFKILSAITMGPRERIVLLQIGETQFLVGVVPGGIQMLHVLERPIDIPSTPSRSSTAFPSLLGAALKRGKIG